MGVNALIFANAVFSVTALDAADLVSGARSL